jgi:hypothetical protein
MKRLMSSVALLLALACAVISTAAAQTASPPTDGPVVFVGKWQGEQVSVVADPTPTAATYVFVLDKKSELSATSTYVIPNVPEFAGEVKKIKVKGESVTFEVTYPNNTTASYDLTLKDGRLVGWGRNYHTNNRFRVNLERAPASIAPPATR